MTARLAIFICLSVLVSGSAQAAKLYKIVDENGSVTYSQFPPQPKPQQDQSSTLKVAEMNVDGESASQVRAVGKKQYCGEIELPVVNPKNPEEYLELGEYKYTWTRELEGDTDLNDVRFRLHMNRYNLSRDPSEAGQRKRDLQCAVQWVDNQKGDVQKAQTTLKNESEQLQQEISRIQSQRDKRCGSQPYRDPNQPGTQILWDRWSECYYEYQDELYELEYKVSQIRVK